MERVAGQLTALVIDEAQSLSPELLEEVRLLANSETATEKLLPLVLVISALSSLLFHWGILQRVTGAFAFLLRRTLGIDGPLALAAAVHIFVGMVEAPLLVRPYLLGMSRGEMLPREHRPRERDGTLIRADRTLMWRS